MPGVIIFKTSEKYIGYDFSDRSTYRTAKGDIRKNGDKIMWKKGNVSFEQIRNAKETIESLVEKLNNGEEPDLAGALERFFECGEKI